MHDTVRRYLLSVDDNLGNATGLLALAAASLHIAYYFLNSSIGYPDPIHARAPVFACLLLTVVLSVFRSKVERTTIGLASLIALLATCPSFFTYILFYESSVVASAASDQVVRQIELLVAIGISMFLLPSSKSTVLLVVASCLTGFLLFVVLEDPDVVANPLANSTISAAWIMGMVLLAHIAHRKTTQTEVSARTARALTGSLAHEIRTPLTSIHSYAKGIENHLASLLPNSHKPDAALSEKIFQLTESARAIQKETEFSSLFIEMALTATRDIDEAKYRSALSLAKIARDAIRRFPFNNDDEFEMLNVCLDDDFTVYGNPQILTHTFFNLLKNAIFFAQTGGDGQVTIALDSGSRTISFTDNGPGIPRKNQQLIYEPFFTTRTAQTGAGLGLWFSRRALEDMGGNLLHHNLENGGCRFVATFPSLHKSLIEPREKN